MFLRGFTNSNFPGMPIRLCCAPFLPSLLPTRRRNLVEIIHTIALCIDEIALCIDLSHRALQQRHHGLGPRALGQ